jgi:hypothetical protein
MVILLRDRIHSDDNDWVERGFLRIARFLWNVLSNNGEESLNMTLLFLRERVFE